MAADQNGYRKKYTITGSQGVQLSKKNTKKNPAFVSTETPLNDINELASNYILIKYNSVVNIILELISTSYAILTIHARSVLYILSKLPSGTNGGLSLIVSLYIWLDMCRPFIKCVCDKHACISIPFNDYDGIYCFNQNPANKSSGPCFNTKIVFPGVWIKKSQSWDRLFLIMRMSVVVRLILNIGCVSPLPGCD